MSAIDTENLPLIPGAVAGVVTWVLGYVFTYLLVATDVDESALNQIVEFFEGDSATYELVGWVFYNAHLVDISYEGLGPFSPPRNFIGGEDGFTVLLYVIPPLLLVAAGLAVARLNGATETNQGAVAGALVVPGYLVVTAVGVFLFEITVGGASGAPALASALIIAGVVYPVVFGALGGVIAAATADEPTAREAGGAGS